MAQLIKHNLTTTSLIVADKFGKRHDDVLRRIRLMEAPEEFNARNFAVVEYVDSKGESRPAYELTRDGFALLVMGFTGKAAMAWKIKFLEAFNAMEAELLEPAPDTLPFSMAELTEEAYKLLKQSEEAKSRVNILHNQISRLFSVAQHNAAFAPKPIPAPKKETLVRAYVRKLPKCHTH